MAGRGVEPATLAMVWAGQSGVPLGPLTAHRAPAAIPFGGVYRLIDFTLSNLVNSGLDKVAVLTQYKSYSLHRHLARAWQLPPMLGRYVLPVPAQQRRGDSWYRGDADAILQSLNVIHREQPDLVVVTGAEQVYRADLGEVVRAHAASGADVTVAATWQPGAVPARFGVIQVDPGDPARVTACEPWQSGTTATGAPGARVLVSAGVYVLAAAALADAVDRDAHRTGSAHDLARDVIPDLVARGAARVHLFGGPPGTPAEDGALPYWRDITGIEAYLHAQADLLAPGSILAGDDRWPVYAEEGHHRPATVLADGNGRPGRVANSMLSPGVTITGAAVDHSILSPRVQVQPGATLTRAIVFHHVRIGRDCTIRDAIIDNDVTIPDGVSIGVDHDHDRARGLPVTTGGTVLVGSRRTVPA